MSLLRHLLFLYAIGISCFVLLAFGLLQIALGYTPWIYSLLLVPWVFGVLGVLGLIGAWPTSTPHCARRLQLMLYLGVGAALVCAAIAIWWATAVDFPITFLLVAFLIFLAIPLGLAVSEIRRLGLYARRSTASDARKQWGVMLGIVVPLVVVGLHIGAKEWIYLGYAKDLGQRALNAAEDLAKEREFCVIGGNGETNLVDLDEVVILQRALRLPLSGNDHFIGKAPHFGIRIQDEIYWWSFRGGDFFAEPSEWAGRYRTTCNSDPIRPSP